MKQLTFLVFAVCLAGCTGATKNSKFPAERALTSYAIPVDTILLRYPYRVAVKEDVIVVLDLHPMDDYLHAFFFFFEKHIASFFRLGWGGVELLSAEIFRFVSLDAIWVLDANRMNMVRWSLAPTSDSVGREEVINLDKSFVRTLDFCLTDSGFIVPDYTGNQRYHFADKNGYVTGSAGVIPAKENKKANAGALAQAWRGFYALNPGKNTLAVATQLGEVLEIYHLDTGVHAVLYGSGGEPQFQIVGSEGVPVGIMGYFDVQITDSFIYALFSGQSFKEITKNAMAGKINERGGRYIHVFDLQGQPVCRYILDRAVCGIDVHEDEQLIYAVDANSDDPVVTFNMYHRKVFDGQANRKFKRNDYVNSALFYDVENRF
jgi:hypothetical protein